MALKSDKIHLVAQERAAEALRSGALQTYKQQVSFGLHVLVMMGTFYAVGHIAGTALSPRTTVVCPSALVLVTCCCVLPIACSVVILCTAAQRSASTNTALII